MWNVPQNPQNSYYPTPNDSWNGLQNPPASYYPGNNAAPYGMQDYPPPYYPGNDNVPYDMPNSSPPYYPTHESMPANFNPGYSYDPTSYNFYPDDYGANQNGVYQIDANGSPVNYSPYSYHL